MIAPGYRYYDIVAASTNPDPPTGVSASDGTYSDYIKITWDSVPDAYRYHVYRNASNDFEGSSNLGYMPASAGTFWYDEVDDYNPPEYGQTYYYWIVTENPSGDRSQKSGSNSGYLAATPQPSITVTSPNGGENWQRGTSHSIAWSSSGSVGSNVNIILFSQSGNYAEYFITNSTSNDGSFLWNIPSNQSIDSDYRIKINSISNPSISDFSNSDFSITGSTDSTDPDTSIISGPSGTISNNTFTFYYSGTDNVTSTSNLVYSHRLIEEGKPWSWSSYSDTPHHTYNNWNDGTYTFMVRAKDQAGNVDASPATRTFTIGESTSGKIFGWGGNTYGQLPPPAGNDFVSISASYYHCIALKSDGSIIGWGRNIYGQATPPVGNDFVAIDTGSGYSLALKSDSSIVGWGVNNYGQATPPVGNDFVAIAAGGWHSIALKFDGSIVGWGDNSYGQATPPVGDDFVAIVAGGWHSLALKSDGSIVGWGANSSGEATPPAGNDFVTISASYYHSLALKSDGSIVGWGHNGSGQATPPVGNDFVAIETGSVCSFALSDGPHMVTVPYVIGLPQAAAQSAMTAAGLVVGNVTTAHSNTVPAGNVISQSYAGGSSVVIGSAVDLVISDGLHMVTAPNVLGVWQASAQSAMTAAGLAVGNVTTAYSNTVPTGNVISQSPAGGSSVIIGSAVDLVVSLGVQMATVPTVTGQIEGPAKSAIIAAGLVVGNVTTAYNNTVPAGNVISQSPVGGSSVVTGSTVDLIISDGGHPLSAILLAKCKVKAGKTAGKDSISFSGVLEDITAADLNGAGEIYIAIVSDVDGLVAYHIDNDPLIINQDKVMKGKYSHRDKQKGISFKLDANNRKFTLKIKNADLTGLDCPLALEIEVGNYFGEGTADESIVNGLKKPIPIQFMSGYKDKLRVDKIKAKKGKKPSTDSFSAKGGFSLKDEPSPITSMTLFLGDQPFDLTDDKGTFTYKRDKKTSKIKSVAYKSGKGETPQIKARFDFVKCAYSVSIKKAELDTTSGQTAFGVLIDMSLSDSDYNESVEVDLH